MALAQQTRDIKELPLNESARIALRESQEEKALGIENRRRKAKGEEPLASLDEDEPENDEAADEDAETDSDADADADEEEIDVLLTEAGNVLVDSLVLRQRAYAARTPETEDIQ